jgi:mannitol/fructose-specific phosphotransferase system IIA component
MSLTNQIQATVQMKSIKQVMEDVGEDFNDTHVIEPSFIGHIRGRPMFISAILEHTAVIHPINLPKEKVAVNLGGVDVWPQDIRWRRRDVEEVQIRIINKRIERHKATTL